MNRVLEANRILKGKVFFSVLITVFLIIATVCTSFAQETTESDPVELFQKGQTAHEKGNLQEALKFYDEAIKIAPEFPEAEYQRGTALLSLNETVEAERAFRRAIQLRENWSLAMTALGTLLVQRNQFAEAEKLLNKSIEISDINFSAYSALADLKLRTNADKKELVQLLAKIQYLTTKANPNPGIWTSRAALERALGEKESAKKSISEALLLYPNYKPALIERAEMALSESDYASALKDAQIIRQVSSDPATAMFLTARVKTAEGNSSEALEILDTIKDPTPEVLAFRDKIIAYNSQSAEDLENQLKSDEKNAVVLGRLCSLYRAENPVKSLGYCQRAYEAEPNNINHVIGFGAALVQAKKFDVAVTLFRQVLEVVPDNYTAHANLAIALFQLNRFEEAKTEYLWLTEKQPDLPITFYFLAITYDRLTEYTDAMANYQQFLRIADQEDNKDEIDRVTLRLPSLQKLIKRGMGKK